MGEDDGGADGRGVGALPAGARRQIEDRFETSGRAGEISDCWHGRNR